MNTHDHAIHTARTPLDPERRRKIHTFGAGLLFVLTSLGLLAAAMPVQGQGRFAHHGPEWWGRLEQQLVQSLDAPVAQVRAGTLQNVVYFAANHRGQVNLERAVPSLLRIYETEPDERLRVMALSALHAIDQAAGMERLARLVEKEPSARLQRLTRAAVADHHRRHARLASQRPGRGRPAS